MTIRHGTGRGKLRQVRKARAELFHGMYDGSSGRSSESVAVVRCPRCKRTVGMVTGSGWRQSRCDTCGSSLWMRQLDRSGRRYHQVRLLNPDYSDDDPIGRRFAMLEIE